MNKQLKFSWGHILAFLALIVISYISFVGKTYLTDGDFLKAGIEMAVIDVSLFAFFIGAQMMKATARKFSRCIWFERIFVLGSPFVFIFAMSSYSHFWTVNSQDKEIVDNFTNAISASKQMFEDYKSYSIDRIDNYDQMLENVIANCSTNPKEFYQCGFSMGNENIQKQNMVKTLRLQLLSENYDSLRNAAIKWIDLSNNGASTLNVFLLGNVKEIKKAIHGWNKQLIDFSLQKLSNEEFNDSNEVFEFEEKTNALQPVDEGLDGLTTMFIVRKLPNITSSLIAIAIAIILYLCLLFPYILQDRHTKSKQRLFRMEKEPKEEDFNFSLENDEDDDDEAFTL